MTTIPTWLAYAAPAIALVALVVSVSSLMVARRTYHRAGAGISIEFALFRRESREFLISLRNEGLAKAQIQLIVLQFGTHLLPMIDIYEAESRAAFESRVERRLPIWLDGGEAKVLYSQIDRDRWPDSGQSVDGCAVIELGNGQVLRSPLEWP